MTNRQTNALCTASPENGEDVTVAVFGATSPRGQTWVEIRRGGSSTWVKFVDFADPAVVRRRLATNQILLDGGEWKDLHSKVAKITEFPPAPIIEQPGWSGSYFALPSGEVFAPEQAPAPHLLFEADTRKCLVSGTSVGWRRRVARPLADHPIPCFALMCTFAAPLLILTDRIGNFGFELSGPGGTGKSTLQHLAASVLGAPDDSSEGHYWITLNSTQAGIASALKGHADLPMILDEVALQAPGQRQRGRGAAIQDLAFQLGSGHEKLKHGQPSPASYRTVFLISTNQSLRDLAIAEHAETLDAAADRLMTIAIPRRISGVFEGRPDGFAEIADFAESLINSARHHHGEPFRRFLRKLVQHRADNEESLRTRISEHLASFRNLAGAINAGGSDRRVVDAFGLIMAAGRLAQRYRVLPGNFDCSAAALYCYNLHCVDRNQDSSFVNELIQISRRQGLPWLDKGKLASMTDIQLDRSVAFLHRNRSRQIELLFWPPAFKRLFPDWVRLLRSPQMVGILNGDSDRTTVQRLIRAGRKDRVYCFILPS